MCLEREKAIPHVQRARDLARDLRVIAVLLGRVRQPPRDGADAAIAQQAQQAAAVGAAGQRQHPFSRIERPAPAGVVDRRAEALEVVGGR